MYERWHADIEGMKTFMRKRNVRKTSNLKRTECLGPETNERDTIHKYVNNSYASEYAVI